MTRRRYDVHGVGLTIETNDSAVADAVRERLAPFAADDGADDLRFVCDVGGEVTPPAEPGRRVYEPIEGSVTYHPTADTLYARSSHGAVICRAGEGTTLSAAPDASGEALWTLSRPFLTLPLIESLKRRGLYSLHAAAASIGGRGILVAGPTGAGKTTTALALARAGFDLLSDDMVFLADDRGALVAHALPDPLDLTDATLTLFPELASGAVRRPGWPKRQVDLSAVASVTMRCVPEVLAIATVGGASPTRFEPVDADRALIELGPNVLLTEPASSQRHLDALAQLARTARCYEVELGHDLERLAEGLREILLGD